ncbi:MAG: glycosyltransferase family 4 protein [Verrucomicrobiales bacterium]|nr:glycosyltransferase family 4 protein [Verrucomicrobiales bacterium]
MSRQSNTHRILYAVARGDAFGGSSLHVMDMSKRLSEEGHIVRVLVGGTEDMEVPRRFANSGIDFVCLPSLGREINPLKDTKAALAMRREIQRFNPDLISLHASKAGAIGRVAALGINCPLVYTPHCWSFVEGFSKAALYQFIEKLLAPAATQIVTVSEDERQFGLSKGVGKAESTCTIHNGVRDRYADQNPPAFSHEGARLIMVGRFEEQKDQPLLIDALSRITDLDWRLTFIGDGPLRPDCIKQTEELELRDRIEFSGYSESVDNTLTKHDIFALITNWEGFPRSILEAMAASLPVVVTDIGGSRESVLDGATGCLVSSKDINGLADTLRNLIVDQEMREQMGAAGRARYLEHFTFETMFSNYEKLYRSLIEASRSQKRSGIKTADSVPSTSPPYPSVTPVSAGNIKAAKTTNGIQTSH